MIEEGRVEGRIEREIVKYRLYLSVPELLVVGSGVIFVLIRNLKPLREGLTFSL